MSALEMDDVMKLLVWILNEEPLTCCIQLKRTMLDLQMSLFCNIKSKYTVFLHSLSRGHDKL